MFIGIIGGRTRTDKENIFKIISKFVLGNDVIVSGGAEGVDTFAREYAIDRHHLLVEFLPTKERYPDSDPYLARNRDIVKLSDVILAFPSKNSKGTWYTVKMAEHDCKRVLIFEENEKR